MLAYIILAFGWGPGLNPPIDIHIPNSEELADMIEQEYGKPDSGGIEVEITNEDGETEVVEIH